MSHMQCGWSPCSSSRRRRERATAVAAFLLPSSACCCCCLCCCCCCWSAAISSRTTWLRLRLSRHAAGLPASHRKICSSNKLELFFLASQLLIFKNQQGKYSCPCYGHPANNFKFRLICWHEGCAQGWKHCPTRKFRQQILAQNEMVFP